MPNPIMALLGRTNPVIQGLSQMIGMVKGSQNPQAAINQLSQSDPRLQQVMQVVNQNGGDAKTAFYNMAKQKGIDPNTVISQLRNMGL